MESLNSFPKVTESVRGRTSIQKESSLYSESMFFPLHQLPLGSYFFGVNFTIIQQPSDSKLQGTEYNLRTVHIIRMLLL